jgi:golgin subfamily B member 1
MKSTRQKKDEPPHPNGGNAEQQAALIKLEKQWKRNPKNEELFAKLWGSYLALEAWDSMAQLLHKKIEKQKGPQRVQSLIQLGDLLDEKIGDSHRAIEAFHKVLKQDPDNRRALWSLSVLYFDLEQWKNVIDVYLKRIDLAQTQEERIELRIQLANIYEKRLRQGDKALIEYIQAAKLAPQNIQILLAMEKVATRTKRFRDLVDVYREVVDKIRRLDLRVALYLKLARLHAEHRRDPEEANACYEKALAISGEVPEKLLSVSKIYGEEEEWSELISMYSQLISFAKNPDLKSRLRVEIARLYKEGLRDPTSAFFELVRVARYEPMQRGLIDEIVSLGESCGKHVELAAVLEDISARFPEGVDKVGLCCHLGRLHLNKLNDPKLARRAVENALAADPANLNAQLILLDVLEREQNYSALGESLESFLARTDLPAALAREQRTRLATLCEKKLGRRDRAVELFRKNLQPSEEDAPPEEGQGKKGWEGQLVLLSGRLVAAVDPDAVSNIALEMAEILERHLCRPMEALSVLSKAWPRGKGHPRLKDELIRLARATGSFCEVSESVGEPAAALEQEPKPDGEDSESAAALPVKKQADPWEETTMIVSSPQGGPLAGLWSAVKANPEDLDAWNNLVAQLREKEGEESAFSALEAGCRWLGRDQPRLNLFRKMSMLAQTPAQKRRLAVLLEEFGQDKDAETTYRAVLRADPSDEEALDGLGRLYEARGDDSGFDALLSRVIEGARSSRTRRALLFRRARFRVERLKRLDEGLQDAEALLGLDAKDEEALSFQEDLLERMGRAAELAKVLERHAGICLKGVDRAKLHVRMAFLAERSFGDEERAIRHYRAAVADNPKQLESIESLISLYEKRRDWLGAIEAIEEVAEKTEASGFRARLYYRWGKILEEQLLRPEEAERIFRKAVEGEEPSLDALKALRELARRRGDWVEVVNFGNQLFSGLSDPEEKACLFVELAKVWKEHLSNDQHAEECYEEAYRLDPDNIEAARVVAGLRVKDQRHDEAHELLVRLIEQGEKGEMEEEELASVSLRLAQSAEALGRPEEAEQAYEKALHLAPTDAEVLAQVGYHLFRRGEWKRAIDVYRDILERHGERFGAKEKAEVICRVAKGLLELDRAEEAVTEYLQAIKADPKHLPALRALVEITGNLGRKKEMVEHLVHLRDLSFQSNERWKLSAQIGDALADNPDRELDAADAYRDALRHQPRNLELLEKLRKVLIRSEQFEQAVDVLGQLAQALTNDHQRSRMLKIAAEIASERLDDDRRALGFYLQALQITPLDQRVQAATVKILNRLRDWAGLAALYEDLLRKLPPPIVGKEDVRKWMLVELLELYRYRLNDPKSAIAAAEKLLKIDPGDVKIREDIGRLYEMDGQLDQAIEMHRAMIEASPFSVDSYHALRRIYEQRGQRDHSLCMAATLSFLDEASADEQSLYKAFRHAMPMPSGVELDQALYDQLLLHPRASGLLGQLFGFAADHCLPLYRSDPRDFKLKDRDRLNFQDKDQKLVFCIRDAVLFLGMSVPEVYSKGSMVKGMMAVNTAPVAVLYQEESLGKASLPEMRFIAGRALAFTRPEHLLASALSAKQLRELLDGLVELVLPGSSVHPVADAVANMVKKLDDVIPLHKRDYLIHLATQVRAQAEELSIRDWLEGIEHTCNRVGFVLSGDLGACVSVLKGARVVSPSGSNRSLIRELIFYTISEEYFKLRKTCRAAIV